MNRLFFSIAVLAALGSQTVWAQDVVQAPYGPDGTWVIYELGDDLLTWAEALEDAQSKTREGVTGDLASVHNIKESQVISDLALNGIVWIGLTDREGAAPLLEQNDFMSPQESIELEFGVVDVEAAKFAGWAWTSGEPFTYHNWAGGEPNNWDGTAAGPADSGFEDAAFIREDSLWNDAPGGYAENEPVPPTLQPGTSVEERDGLPNDRLYDYVIEYRTNSPAPFPGIDQVGEDLDPEDLLPPWIGEPLPFLQAGDADQDFDFDQLDLIKVQVAAKYLTGQAATWGEGDWNGAPGGEPGNPPAGNGFFDQLDIIAALGPGHYLKGTYIALAGPGTEGHGQTSDLVYVPEPSTIGMLLIGMVLGLRCFRRMSG